MGKYDSSLTRVVPVFDELFRRDPTGESWIRELLALPRYGTRQVTGDIRPRLREGAAGETYGWGRHEVPLQPPRSLLRWLVRNVSDVDAELIKASDSTKEKRHALLRRDPDVIAEALALLDGRAGERGWHILEGPSYPDVFLDTDEAVIVVEGKRTEAGPTTGTTFMPERHQMLRHMDCAFELSGHRQVFGFFIVEGNEVSSDWVRFASETVSHRAIESSLPHRTTVERELIKHAFLGVTTWHAVCDALGVDESVLIDEVGC